MPILFLSLGESLFMGKGSAKGSTAMGLASQLYDILGGDNNESYDIDKDGSYYIFI